MDRYCKANLQVFYKENFFNDTSFFNPYDSFFASNENLLL